MKTPSVKKCAWCFLTLAAVTSVAIAALAAKNFLVCRCLSVLRRRKIAGGIDFNNDGTIDATNDLILPGADPNKPDIYVQYDWMDYGLNDIPCVSNSDCTTQPGPHAGETCTGSTHAIQHEELRSCLRRRF
jgi:hypothetical protein